MQMRLNNRMIDSRSNEDTTMSNKTTKILVFIKRNGIFNNKLLNALISKKDVTKITDVPIKKYCTNI